MGWGQFNPMMFGGMMGGDGMMGGGNMNMMQPGMMNVGLFRLFDNRRGRKKSVPETSTI